MKINYRQLLLKLFVWFVAEIVLTYTGLDNLADYSEYLKSEYLKEQSIGSMVGCCCHI